MREISVKTIRENIFELVGDKWMLVTAGNQEKCNTMTASWGGAGVLWGKDVAFLFVRPTRYTYEFIERESTFSLSFFLEGHRETLGLCGSKSGRDIDKFAACGLTPAYSGGTPYIGQADRVLICRKLYAQDIDPEKFTDASLDAKWYHGDYHRMYVVEITQALSNG